MPHHGNEEEHGSSEGRSQGKEQENEPQKPVIHDNRKVDPKTGQARHPDQERAAAGTRLGGRALPGGGHPQQRRGACGGIRGPGRGRR